MAHAFIPNPLEEGAGEFESTLQNESQSGYTDKPCLDFPHHSKKMLVRVILLGVECVQNVLY